ncbi:MAG: isocitrate/isopropylmalate family dehydrogenase, partial [Proteobacteria bacterium]|nr:isocitrate/isopropylmalate family dehydrogenase [Pseudomonadota bacterium]
SAPDITGQGIANPIATILSFAMMLRYSFELGPEAEGIENAVENVLAAGLRTNDIMQDGKTRVSTSGMGDAILRELETRA